MRAHHAESWVGVVVVLLLVAGTLPVLTGWIETLIPLPLWILTFLLFFTVSFWPRKTNARAGLMLYLTATAVSWVLIVSAPGAVGYGLTSVVLFVAVAGVEHLRLPWLLSVIVLNTIASDFSVDWADQESTLSRIMVAFTLLMIQLCLIGVFIILRRERQLRAELAQAYVGLKPAEAILSETAKSAERLHISRELHDLLGHQLTVLSLKLESARYRSQGEALEAVEQAQQLSRGLLRDLRNAVSTLRRSTTSSLSDALLTMSQNLPEVQMNVEVSGDLDVDEGQHIALLRALQELVTNTIRHAQARDISVLVDADSRHILLEYRDDGQGAEPLTLGNGLRGVTERFTALGGDACFSATQGFQVRAWMPKR